MIDINTFTDDFLRKLKTTFSNRLYFVGLQGSYARGEANETSDIDIVVILDELSAVDIQVYNALLDTTPHRELMCGFLSGKNELLNWEPSDLFQFYYDTKPLFGTLDELLPLLTDDVVARAIKIGACNIYHGCVHNMIYDKNHDILKSLYKSASFVIQAIAFKLNGRYIRDKKELVCVLPADEKVILDTFLMLKNGDAVDFQKMSELLFDWSKKLITAF